MKALRNIVHGIMLNGKRINNIRYATLLPYTLVLADSIFGLYVLINRINGASEQYILKLNTSATRFMIITKQNI